MTNFIDIGVLLKSARKAQRLSQGDLAAKLGMSRATISGIENGSFTELGVRKLAAVLAEVGLQLNASARQTYPTYHQLKAERDATRGKTGDKTRDKKRDE